MSEEVETEEPVESKRSKFPLILGLVLALAGGGGGFFAVYSGMLLSGDSGPAEEKAKAEPVGVLPDVAFVPIDPMVVSVGSAASNQHLRFRAQLEVFSQYRQDVEMLIPRVVDVLNGYLRALETADLEAPSALVRLRAQMLRRVQIVTGQGRVKDLLIMEFVLN